VTTLEEITAWSLDETRAEIAVRLPPGWHFEEKALPGGGLRAKIFRLSPSGDPIVEWEHLHIDHRYVLLGAFGFLWTRNHRPDPTSPWIRRHNPTREAMARRVNAFRCTVPDPEDVDPEEVKAVYEATKKS